ncbi:N-acetylmuramoyl-L-alanine amidase [Kitasatospora sp. NPDC089797]|uniref:N-acetylmuramoyl-L-alanine amidase n=1 Tax=Kitasatospora sp. NPDC089797 TaxID=3155298 RepID=UPI003443A183
MTGQPSRPPRRSALLRTTTVVAAAVPLCTAGWFGWHALDDSGPAGAASSAPPAAVRPATDQPTGQPTDRPSATPEAPPAGSTATGSTATSSAATSSAATGSTPAAAPPAGDLTGRTIVLDPGHNPGNFSHPTEINRQVDVGNGHKECDTTGTETNAGYTEADYTLDVTRRARALLTARGAKVVLVQDGDRPWGPCVDERARAGADAHADVALSVHGDGGPASGSGFHVIMPAKVVAGKADNSAIVGPSHRLGLLLRDRFHAATGEPYADYIADEGLDTRSDLGGLNLSTVPKVFIECGNMRNSADARRMTDPQWRQQAAQGISDALAAFLTTH